MLKVSIITTVLNGADTIRACIRSIQSQTLTVEHIIIDGGSTDSTLEIIEEYKSDIAGVISEPDDGIYDAMNKGLQLVSGDIVGILNADDFYAGSTVLEKVANAFADKKVDSCYGDLVYVDSKNINQVFRYLYFARFGFLDGRPGFTFCVLRSFYEYMIDLKVKELERRMGGLAI